ncbi:putative short-chain dehydrogenase/reductase SDR [Burkholderia cenocepacia]|uniref:hypothetical protein n=1 Tax=Burkholderia latens TaxID=488446 RepID=UPI0004F739EE|nr:hypothetical protein [Burkholderia latens]AIO38812.1 putative short-chain dehydrogenase/reductase SDR [Burkholderia cenocepacia]MBR7959682.1 hypothetical protein [Burkholderia vietnamiensis]
MLAAGTAPNVAPSARIAEQNGIDTDGARKVVMDSPGGIPLGRPCFPGKWHNPPVSLSPHGASAIIGAEYAIDGRTVPTA